MSEVLETKINVLLDKVDSIEERVENNLTSMVQKIEKSSVKNEESQLRLYNRVGELEKKDAIREVQYTNILSCLKIIQDSVEMLKGKPAKKMELINSAIIYSLTGIFLGYMLGHFVN